MAYAVFPKEVVAAPERWIDQTYNVVQRTEMPKGGHFAALEQPDLMVQDIRLIFLPSSIELRLTQNSGEISMNRSRCERRQSDESNDESGNLVGNLRAYSRTDRGGADATAESLKHRMAKSSYPQHGPD